jgi:hypothetical protein
MKDKAEKVRDNEPKPEPVVDPDAGAPPESKVGDMGKGSREETQGGSAPGR